MRLRQIGVAQMIMNETFDAIVMFMQIVVNMGIDKIHGDREPK